MKLLGFFLMLAGWCIVLAALVLLAGDAARDAFTAAGIGVQVIGLVLVIRGRAIARGVED